MSAGGMPTKQGKKYCNDGTPFMKQNGCLIFNADWVGLMYAGAEFSRKLRSEDWQKVYFLKELSTEQLEEARNVGLKMAEMIKADRLKPLHPMGRMGPLLDKVTQWFLRD